MFHAGCSTHPHIVHVDGYVRPGLRGFIVHLAHCEGAILSFTGTVADAYGARGFGFSPVWTRRARRCDRAAEVSRRLWERREDPSELSVSQFSQNVDKRQTEVVRRSRKHSSPARRSYKHGVSGKKAPQLRSRRCCKPEVAAPSLATPDPKERARRSSGQGGIRLN